MKIEGRRLPVPTPESAPFWSACREGRLIVQRCGTCAAINWFPRRMCRVCSSDDLAWHDSTGRGSVYTYTAVHRAPSPGFPEIYVLALVDVEDGPRLMTHVVECDPAAVRVGMPVEVVFERLGEEISVPVFRPR